MAIGSAGHAATLLVVDLSTPNQITITATAGTSPVTISGSDTTGFLLADFFSPSGDNHSDSLVSGDLTSAENAADGDPQLFRDPSSRGLNVWSYTNDPTSDFVAGNRAFSGSATWTLPAAGYAEAFANAWGGSVFFPADTDAGISGATLLGEWEREGGVVPLPAAAWLFGASLMALGAARAGRRRHA
jgi:hypothetical protein